MVATDQQQMGPQSIQKKERRLNWLRISLSLSLYIYTCVYTYAYLYHSQHNGPMRAGDVLRRSAAHLAAPEPQS